jgi:hypothetical protein
VEVVGYITTVIVLLFVCGSAISLFGSFFQAKKKPHKLAGTAIPEMGEGLDISKRYDIVYYRGQFAERLHDARIVGYVDWDDDESLSKMYLQGRWLVVEFADGRRTYLMPDSILSLQESAPA